MSNPPPTRRIISSCRCSKSGGKHLNLLAGQPLMKRGKARESDPHVRCAGGRERSAEPGSQGVISQNKSAPFLNGLAGAIPNRHRDETQAGSQREPVMHLFDVTSSGPGGRPRAQQEFAMLRAITPELCPAQAAAATQVHERRERLVARDG